MSASPTALTNRPTMAGRSLCRWLMAVFLGMAPWLHAQTDGPAPDFEKTSLTLRTALHFDPAAEGPLQKLVKLYVESGKRSELTGLYKSHLAQYPDDESATIVLARLFVELSDDQAGTFLQTAVAKHAQNALLAWVHHRFLTSRFDPRALEELDRAIALEVNATRRSAWLTDLMKQAAAQNRGALVRGRFEALLNAQMLTLDQRLKWARVALGNQLPDVAALLVKGADVSSLQGDASVEAVLVLAETEAAGGQKIEAAKRLDELLGKLAADYWRRREVLLLRLQVAGDAADRDRLIAEARKKWETAPSNEAEALSLADLLTAVQQKTEAATVLEKAANLSPQSRLLETRLLDLLSTTNQEARAIQFLDQRLTADPKREDLALQRVRLQLASGRSADAMEKLKALVVGRTPIQQATLHLDLARWLRTRNLLTEAATVLEQLLAGDSSRWDARKELGEIYGVLKRTDELEKLFNIPIPDDVPPEVRMEVVQFLMAQKQWSQARAALEKWVASRPAELEGRLLLARIQAITGASADSDALLLESRKLCDTDARYAAWLNAAFELASEAGGESAFLDAERQRLWPLTGETWDTPRIQRLLALADLAGNAQLDGEAEKIVRAAMAETTLNAETRDDLQLRLLDVIQRQTGREKEVETQLLALSKTSSAKQDDLRLRLAMLYHGAGRADLFTQLLEQVDIDRCSEAEVLVRASNASKEIGLNEPSAKMIERAVKLQPDQPQPWVQWVSRLADIGDEPAIRQALQQMLGMAKTWNLHEETRDLLRRHLAASCWREAGRLICQEPIPPTASAACSFDSG
jgi:thioredoxin-like negative regulator of GroEL